MNRRIASIASLAVALCAWIALGAGERAQADANGPVLASAVKAVAGVTSHSIEPKHHQLWMEVTAYCPCTKCCGPHAAGITASGLPVSHNEGKFVAADTNVLPFGSKLSIPGYGDNATVPVIDRGGAIKGHRIDVFFPSHQQALEWGRRWVMVTVDE